MANIKSAEKRARQSTVRRDRNQMIRSSIRTAEKKLRAAVAGDKTKVPELFKAYASTISKAAQKGICHKKTAARKISRLAQFISK